MYAYALRQANRVAGALPARNTYDVPQFIFERIHAASRMLRRTLLSSLVTWSTLAGQFTLFTSQADARTWIREGSSEVLIFDSSLDVGPTDEGLVRQRLGLVNSDGKPQVDEEGNPVPLVSADGTKKAFDMRGGAGTEFRDAVAELADDGGTLTIITHGRKGEARIDGGRVAGFGAGTGANADEECIGEPYQLDGMGARTNVTLNLIVCEAARAAESGAPTVSETLQAELASLGGSVTTVNETDGTARTKIAKCARIVEGVQLTPDEIEAVNEAIPNIRLKQLPFAEQYTAFQMALNDAVGPGKVVATIHYSGEIGATVIELTGPPSCDFVTDEEQHITCVAGCPAPIVPTVSDWGLIVLTLLGMTIGTLRHARRRAKRMTGTA